jgi:hypothetical protein
MCNTFTVIKKTATSPEGDNILTSKTTVAELIDLVYFRYRRHNTDGNTKKHSGQRSRGFNNGAFTNDYANTSKIISDTTLIACNFIYFGHV